MKFAAIASLIILFGAGSTFAADTDAGTAGRPGAVLSEADCVAVWHTVAGSEFTRFHRGHEHLLPVNARGIVTNFQQADTDNDGSVSRAEFIQACKLGLVARGDADRTIAAGGSY
jgi:hypothetical protein